ncbi:MAG: endonuclease MutS2 [Clostridiales bacterium]|nr:endonuclease MutS2 [Clostridiales bacterium]
MSEDKFVRAVKTLEFDKIRTELASLCLTSASKEMAEQLMPSNIPIVVKQTLDETTDAKAMQRIKGMPSFSGIVNVRDSMDKAEKGATLTTEELLGIGRALQAARSVKEYGNTEHGEENSLTQYFNSIKPVESLERHISKCIVSVDVISDEASEKLYDIRRHMRHEHERVKSLLKKYISSPQYASYLMEPIVTMRDGRYVIPVKSENKNDVKGIVHDTSSSGSTLFVEPLAVVEANNSLRILEKQEQEEIERILSMLTSECLAVTDTLNVNYDALTILAFIFAKSQLSYRMDGCAPKINENYEINIVRGKHPLLPKETAVPISVDLGKKFNTLVITGPNTGGKTVSIKTIGLYQMMVQAGLHVPVDENSEACVFEDILADIGDEQSIEQSLSTFSSHMVNVVDIIEKADKGTLVLLDELGAGTDPVEGAALAVSIIEKVREKGALCAATTHYAELKSYAISTDGVTNASCEFDVATLRPTYRLIIGTPGKSNAFAISSKLGLPNDVIANAEKLVSGNDKRFENVIEKLEIARIDMERAKSEAYDLLKEAKKTKEESDAKANKQIEMADKELERARVQARGMVEGAKASSEFIFSQIEKVKNSKEENKKEEVRRARESLKQHLKDNADVYNPVEEKTAEDYVLPRNLVIGDKIIVVNLGQHGEVVSEPDNQGNIAVRVGSAIMRTNLKNLMLDESKPQEKPKNYRKTGDRELGPAATFSPELNLRGMYGEDAKLAIDKYLDDAQRTGIKSVTLIHGKGTGALRKAVSDFLKSDRRVKSFRLGNSGEGDTGVTIVDLK